MTHNVSDLGDLEREVLRLVWDLGPSTADRVQKALSRPLKESTVRTVLKRLEAKGHLSHHVDHRTFIYEAADTRGRAAARAVKRIVDRFCGGSLEEVLLGLVDTRILDRRELQRLAEKIANAQADDRVARRKK
jgi:BlaI family transcriptional regulator, penicillinase repressor